MRLFLSRFFCSLVNLVLIFTPFFIVYDTDTKKFEIWVCESL